MSLPNYIYSPGQVAYKAPFKHDNCHIYSFFVNGKIDNIQRTLDQTLNIAARKNCFYKALSSSVMVQFAKLNEVYSLSPNFCSMGKITETDAITWVLIGEIRDSNNLIGVYWHPVHMWVDNHQAVSVGREIYGYPKQLGKISMPTPSTEKQIFSLETNSHSSFGHDKFPTKIELFQVSSDTLKTGNSCNRMNLSNRILKCLINNGLKSHLTSKQFKTSLTLLSNTEINQVFLKQCPDTEGVKALYQGIVSTTSKINSIHSSKFFPTDHLAFNLSKHDAIPLSETLGIEIGKSKVEFACYQHMDFTTQTGVEVNQVKPRKKQKVIIIGGGVAAMSSAFHITERANWHENYDITVHQTGWRLGGKGASGRNQKKQNRIEEHGLHIWFGCYHNSFSMMNKAYKSLNRDEAHPMQTLSDAFKPHSLVGLAEKVSGKNCVSYIEYPATPNKPGSGYNSMSVKRALSTSLEHLSKALFNFFEVSEKNSSSSVIKLTSLVGEFLTKLELPKPSFAPDLQTLVMGFNSIVTDLRNSSSPKNLAFFAKLKNTLASIKNLLTKVYAQLIEENDDIRQLYISIDVASTIIIGIIDDNVLELGFDSINDSDFMDWLEQHGANNKFSINSGYVRSLYDLVFAYEDGEYSKPNLEAGTMIRALLRMTECYQGAFMYKMQGGMGDIVFEPLYNLLKNRGVKFEFFSAVSEIKAEGNSVSSIYITKQIETAEGVKKYDPLIEIDGLQCWPSEPIYSQLDDYSLLEKHYSLLEFSPEEWSKIYEESTGNRLRKTKLVQGKDFDQVVLATSLATLPSIASNLLESDTALKTMVEKVKTNGTQAFQLWHSYSIYDLGYTHSKIEEPIVSGYVKPFDTWAPMSHLLKYENWPQLNIPKTVSYHCSVIPDTSITTQQDTEKRVESSMNDFLGSDMALLLPKFNYDTTPLNDDNTYIRANIYGSERYVVSHVGTTKYRLGANDTRFSNLYLAGDWTKNGINLGCIEAAVNSGMMVARAMCGYPSVIEGEFDFD